MGSRKITPDDERSILFAYSEGKTGSEILDILDGKFKTTKTVYDTLRRFGVSRRNGGTCPASVDHFYFAKIDTPEKAYVLGLIVTGGWVRSDGRPEVALQLVVEDKNIIEFVKREWKTDRKILVLRKGKFKGLNGKVYQSSPMARIAVQSERMHSDLSAYGVVKSKTRKTWMPLLDEWAMPYLIRGIIDGDGTIYRHGQTGQPCVRFVGSPFLVGQVTMYLTMILGVGYRNPSLKSDSDFLSYVDYSISDDVVKILDYAYGGEMSVSIGRKMESAKSILSEVR